MSPIILVADVTVYTVTSIRLFLHGTCPQREGTLEGVMRKHDERLIRV